MVCLIIYVIMNQACQTDVVRENAIYLFILASTFLAKRSIFVGECCR